MANPFEVPVVMYHSINDCQMGNPLGCLSFYRAELIAHLTYLTNKGFECITLSDLLQRALDGKVKNTRVAILTFDDGFLDNYLVAKEILNDFKAKGTIFVNPGHASSDPARCLQDVPDAWGSLNFDEMRRLEQSGVFEIQSHTLSHEDVFLSDRLIDVYSPEKANLYYWLIWKLFPYTRSEWHGNLADYSELVPTGYPIFEYGRPLRGRQFLPSPEFVDQCIQQYRLKGSQCFTSLQSFSPKGAYETEDCYAQRIEDQIFHSKRILERELSKPIQSICFPGDAYSDGLLSRAQTAGYKIYMRHPREKRVSNLAALQAAQQILERGQMIGLQRFVFNYDYRGFLPKKTGAYWTAKFTIEATQGNAFFAGGLSAARLVKRKILRREPKSRLQRGES